MSNVLLYIDGVDRTEYFRPPLRVNPGGDSVIGSATIQLSQQAGGLDLRPMMNVQIYVPFNTTTNAGIATKGRLFGGVISKRSTGNVGTTKTWSLPCWDYNIILKKHRRRAATVYAVTLTADTLQNQIIDLFAILQGAAPDVQLDVVSGVALTTSLPAVSYPGGHTWEWYLQQLLIATHTADPAVFPAYYMGVGTTFGSGDTFGPPVLWVYDGASPPASVVTFSDTPTGSEKSVFAQFTRDTDATVLNQVAQSWWNGTVRTATDTASQSNYPSPYEDFSGGTGFWTDGEVISDTSSANATEAQALVDNVIRAKGSPRDSFKWGTYERVMPGEYVDLEWTLEGIPPITKIRIASATFEWEEPNVIYTTLTANTRRLGLFDDGTTGFFASPIEGDDVPPLPPTSLAATSVYDQVAGQARNTLTWVQSASADAFRNVVYIRAHGSYYEPFPLNGLYTTYSYFAPAGSTYGAYVSTEDPSGNESEPSNIVTGTSAVPQVPYVLNGSFEELSPTDATLPRYWTRFNTGAGTSVSTTTAADGLRAAKLSTTGGGDKGGLRSDFVIAHIIATKSNTLRVLAKASAGTPLKYAIYFYDSALAQIGSPTTGSKSVTTTYAEYTVPIANVATAAYVRIELYNDAAATRDVFVDGVRWNPQASIDDIEDDAITGDKINPTVTLTDQQISLTSTAKITGGSKITLDANGLTAVGTATGAGNYDFYNEVGVFGGRIYSSGASGDFALNVEATYNGAGTTTLGLSGHDSVSITQNAQGHQIILNSAGILYTTGTSAEKHQFDTGSVVIGAGLTDPATDGYLYIPRIDAAPTGTPTNQGGGNTFATCVQYDIFGGMILWVYSPVGGWKSVALT